MSQFYRLFADLIVIVHFGYVSFVLFGLILILIGGWRGWSWVRNPIFRGLHLLAISIVVAEALLGIDCPLTTWEHQLRVRAGQTTHGGAFIADFVHDVMFIDAPMWMFQVCYVLFGLVVLGSWFLIPPRRRSRSQAATPAESDAERSSAADIQG